MLHREAPAHRDARRVHGPPVDRRVGAREVDVLEDAPGALGGCEALRAQAVGVDRDELARLDLAHEGRTDDVEGRDLARDDPAALEATEHERAHRGTSARHAHRNAYRLACNHR